ncbi:MAG: hypothetical protein ACI9XK_000498 [Granulosicoccus sp.]|jgi:hypothetical protein
MVNNNGIYIAISLDTIDVNQFDTWADVNGVSGCADEYSFNVSLHK